MDYKQFIKRLFPFLRSHLGKLILVSFLMILSTALETAIPEITGRIVDNLFSNERSNNSALLFSITLFIVIALSSLFALTSTSLSSWVTNKVIMDLRVMMFSRLLKLPKSYFDKNTTGGTLSKLTYDVEQISSAASVIWLELIKSSLTVIILIVYLFYKNYLLSLSLLILLPLVYLAVKISTLRIRKGSKKVIDSMGKMTHLLDENISGSDLVKIYNAQSNEESKFSQLVKIIRQQRFKVDLAGGVNTSVVNILIGLCLATVVYFSSTFLGMSAGEFLAFFTAMAMLVKPSKSLININKPLQNALIAGNSVFGLIDEKPESSPGSNQMILPIGNIAFNNVSFSYDNKTQSLKNIFLNIKNGETIALVGKSGSGKSTMVNLLNRFYDNYDGRIRIDGYDIKKV